MRDEPAIQSAVAAAGATYLSNDAGSSAASQEANVQSLVSKGATVLIVLAQDAAAIAPSLVSVHARGIPVTGTADFTTPSGKTVHSILLKPVAVTSDNLDAVVESGWITRDKLCAGVTPGSVPACS